ncbi:3-hydroxyacyl-CoA dehydrogenase family protein [Fictibacillus fluitans]|uniref:3-hydroxyacyl-CoA dehydrogenase family protein n=1 Tax=Fictibacillus fluitans TaxID=3058422 RepID=A0ABT8HQE0_9BACL|nr:3-hydroxyacyl-CoA dehydrogenase family protein [Fictibacillus sp. NE201]MDN4522989.1 3-hydroxyacyl-CoA dehydrogenase family protein [Fictibacillus sp. NE201]
MQSHEIQEIAVIGSGTMGSQIAMVCALGGYNVILHDIEKERLHMAEAALMKQMKRRIEKGRLSEHQVTDAFAKIKYSSDLKDLSQTDFVIEAIVEKLEPKRDLFRRLDEITPEHSILATNSSTITSSKLADATRRPEKVCNVHFFNPALVMELVEVVKGPHTAQETAEAAMEVVRNIKKTPVLLQKEISGFIANRILGKLMDEAVYLLENGYATHEEIDLVCKKALNHPIGPFALMDLTGIDVNYFVRQQRFQETGDERDRPAKIVQEKVERGELGRKSGKGFYTYSEPAVKA